MKFWEKVGESLENLKSDVRFPQNPDERQWYHSIDVPLNILGASLSARQLKTYFISSEDGAHTFYLTCDKEAEVYFGTKESSKSKIIGRNLPTQWHEYETDLDQASSPQIIQANKQYYLEVLHAVGSTRTAFVSLGVVFPSNKKAFPITEKYLVALE